jgi:hypothetical protein
VEGGSHAAVRAEPTAATGPLRSVRAPVQQGASASNARDADARDAPLRGLEHLDYAFHDWTAVITTCDRICYQRREIDDSQVFAGQ